MKPTLLAQVLAQKLTGLWIDEANLQSIPLNVNTAADPPGRSAVVSGFDFNAAIQMNRALVPLPLEPFRCYQYGQRTVHLDGCVEVEAAYYSAPPGWIGRRVHVQWDGLQVRLINPKTGQLLREHLRQKRGFHRINQEDRSPRTPPSTSQLLARAARAGSNIGALCQAIHDHKGQIGVRRIQGVLSLAKKFGAPVVDDACAAALDLRIYEYSFVRRYLERRPQLPLTLQQVDPLIRQLTHYRDLINQRTQEQPQ